MKKTVAALALVCILVIPSLPRTSCADKSFKIHLPRGGLIAFTITSCALKNVRVHDFDFSDRGDVFSMVAAPNGSVNSIQNISIECYVSSTPVQSELVDIGPGRRLQEVYCPENLDQIVIDCFGY